MSTVTRPIWLRRCAWAFAALACLTLSSGTVQAQGGKRAGGGKGASGPGGMMGGGMMGGGMPGMGAGGMPMSGPRGMQGGGMPGGMAGGMPGGGMGMSMPGGGGMGMGGMPGLGGLQTLRQKNLKGEDLPPLPELKLDPNGLPAGFTPSQEPPEWMTTTDQAPKHRFEDLQESQPKDWKAINGRIGSIKQAGVFANDDERKLIDEYVDFRLAQLTRPENRLGGKTPAHELQDKFYREINPTTLTKNDKPEVRLFMANKVVALAPQYLNNYHFVSRLQTAILLARLSELVEVQGNGPQNPPVQFTKGLPELLNLTKQDKTTVPAGVRTWGIIGLLRLYNVPNLKIGERSRIVETLVDQLNKSADEPWWNQWRLVEGLGQIKVTSLADRRPIVAQALAQALVDESRDWLVRSEAAYALGQLNYEAGIDLGLIAFQIGRMTQQMDAAYLEDSKDRRWKLCYVKVYGAFKPIETNGAGLLKQAQERGALAAFRGPIGGVFDKILPLVTAVVKNPDGVQAAHDELSKWLQENPPKSDRIHPSEEPLQSKQPTGANPPADAPPAGG